MMSARASRLQKALGLMLPMLIGMAGASVIDFGSVAVSQTVSDRKAEADLLGERGNQLLRTSNYEAALQFYQKALLIYREIRDHDGQAKSLDALGIAYLSLSQYSRAIEYHHYLSTS